MTDPLTAHASPSDTSFSPDWEEGRQFHFRDEKVVRLADLEGGIWTFPFVTEYLRVISE